MMIDLPREAWYAAAAVPVVLVAAAAYLLGRRSTRRQRRAAPLEPGEAKKAPTSRGDLLAAAIATAVAAEGMWETFSALAMPIPLRLLTFAFLELAVLRAAQRAKRSMEERYSAGIDGVAMWVLTCVSALLSAAHEATRDDPNISVVLVRIVAPLVAAWGWERHMSLERRSRGLRSGIAWRITPERIAVRLGLAEASERTAEEVDARRRITRVAQAVKALAVLEAASARPRRLRRAQRRLDRLMQEANEHAGLARDEELQGELLAEIGSLLAASGLSQLKVRAWWTPAPPERTGAPVRICTGRTGVLQLGPVRGAGGGELAGVAGRMRDSVRTLRRTVRTGFGSAPAEEDLARTAMVRSPSVRAAMARLEDRQEEPVRAAQPARTEPVRAPLEPIGAEEGQSRTDDRTVAAEPGPEPAGAGGPARTGRRRTGRTAAARTGRTEVTADVRRPRAYWAEVLAREIRTEAAEGRTWEPDYAVLQERTHYKLSWCEKTVAAARKAAATPDGDSAVQA